VVPDLGFAPAIIAQFRQRLLVHGNYSRLQFRLNFRAILVLWKPYLVVFTPGYTNQVNAELVRGFGHKVK
jgi:hypothetical protein